MTSSHEAFILVGPTAVGKTSIAHDLARDLKSSILSADSMAVYVGMDIGTAKPTVADRREVRYGGIDLVAPSASFSVADYMASCQRELSDASSQGAWIVTGGTGLYVKALLHGMAEAPAGDPAVRDRAERMLEEQGVAGLQAWLGRIDVQRLEALSDPQNPRRLIRAIELAEAGVPVPEKWGKADQPILAGLRMEQEVLRPQIEARVTSMYAEGLLEEARALREKHPVISETAQQAIGYAECWAVLDGTCSEVEAREKTTTRTAQLAKRQMTWFRNQTNVEWIDMTPDDDRDAIKERISILWEQHGPTPLAC